MAQAKNGKTSKTAQSKQPKQTKRTKTTKSEAVKLYEQHVADIESRQLALQVERERLTAQLNEVLQQIDGYDPKTGRDYSQLQQRSTKGYAKFTPARKAAFLEIFGRIGLHYRAAVAAGVDPKTVYNHLDSDPEFAARYEELKEAHTDRLEYVAQCRAIDGWEEPVFQNGTKAGTVRKYDHRLLQFLLAGRRPDQYGQKMKVDAKVSGGVLLLPQQMTSIEEWEKVNKEVMEWQSKLIEAEPINAKALPAR